MHQTSVCLFCCTVTVMLFISPRQRRHSYSTPVLCVSVHSERWTVLQLYRQLSYQQQPWMLQQQRTVGHLQWTSGYVLMLLLYRVHYDTCIKVLVGEDWLFLCAANLLPNMLYLFVIFRPLRFQRSEEEWDQCSMWVSESFCHFPSTDFYLIAHEHVNRCVRESYRIRILKFCVVGIASSKTTLLYLYLV